MVSFHHRSRQLQSGAGNDLYLNLIANANTINSRIIDNGSNNNVIVNSDGRSANTGS